MEEIDEKEARQTSNTHTPARDGHTCTYSLSIRLQITEASFLPLTGCCLRDRREMGGDRGQGLGLGVGGGWEGCGGAGRVGRLC